MTPAETAAARAALDAASRPTPSCILFDRLGGDLTATEREHVAGCARCQTELTLFAELNDPAPAAGEGAAVQWVVAELRRRRSHAAADARSGTGGWRFLRPPRLFAAAAAAVFVLAVGYVTWDREPPVRDVREPGGGYRTLELQTVAPIGDVRVAPRDLEWSPVDGATNYDVVVLEVDRTVLWQGASTTAQVSLPGPVVARFEPGKTILWEVTARNRAGEVVAVSGTGRFRVAVGS
jgi:hypothetical protein